MKNLVIFVVVGLFLALPANTQGIVSEENTWNVKATGFPGFLGTESYMIDGDSTQNGFDYKIIWMTMDSVDASWSYQGLLREDSNIVYFVPPGGTEGILYNFNLEVGDTAWVKNMFCGNEEIMLTIASIDTVEYFNVERKRWELESEHSNNDYWIEGIGSNLGPLHTMYIMCIVCPTWDLLCFHSAGNQYYQMYGTDVCYLNNVGIGEENMESGLQIFPNPVRDKFAVRSLQFVVELVEIYDLSGKKHLEKHFHGGEKNVEIELNGLPAGMYVCRIVAGGRSVVRKLVVY